jgi:hypothetical protein
MLGFINSFQRRWHQTWRLPTFHGHILSTLEGPAYMRPFKVIKKTPRTFNLRVGTHEEVVSIGRLTAHVGGAPVETQEPLVRCRLRGDDSQSCSFPFMPVKTGGGAYV